MSIEDYLAIVRLTLYFLVAFYAIKHRRWVVWLTFTFLIFTTYAYSFTIIPSIYVEEMRTFVAFLLAYIVIRRK